MKKKWLLVSSGIFTWILSGVCASIALLLPAQAISKR
jgi:hypothetical protein